MLNLINTYMNQCRCHQSHYCRIGLRAASAAGNISHFIAIHHYWTRYWLGRSRQHQITELIWSSFFVDRSNSGEGRLVYWSAIVYACVTVGESREITFTLIIQATVTWEVSWLGRRPIWFSKTIAVKVTVRITIGHVCIASISFDNFSGDAYLRMQISWAGA